MDYFIGIDIGTSSVKVVLVDTTRGEEVAARRDAALTLQRPVPGASEQDPDAWWTAVAGLLDDLARDEASRMARVAGIGLSGQMHGAVLLGADDRPLRPAMLWNDARSAPQALALRKGWPQLAAIVGVPAMAGFTAPKIPWLAAHEPGLVERIETVLLPKDYVRLQLTGERATDVTDAAGTWWLDQARRSWCPQAVTATGLAIATMPRLLESPDIAGTLRVGLAARWGLRRGTLVVAGAGDAAAGAIGIGAVRPGDAFLSLGTSGQLFVASDGYRPAPKQAVHAFCHALPDRWYQMAAMLNGASCLAFVAGLAGREVGALVAEAEARFTGPSRLLFLPYLAGERTPHDDPNATGAVLGLRPDTDPADLMQAALDGVAMSFADARDALAASGTHVAVAGVVGGGARSGFWMRILAAATGIQLVRYEDAEKGPALGAARLARIASGQSVADVCVLPLIRDTFEPEPELVETYAGRTEDFRALYRSLQPFFRENERAVDGGAE